jgi:hypothetical protein
MLSMIVLLALCSCLTIYTAYATADPTHMCADINLAFMHVHCLCLEHSQLRWAQQQQAVKAICAALRCMRTLHLQRSASGTPDKAYRKQAARSL